MAKVKQAVEYDDGSHKRFYIYRHKMVGEDQVMEQLTDDRKWTAPFKDAWLIADHDVAVQQAKSEKACFPQRDVDFTVCIGAVDIAVDPYFALEVVA